jgi:hypothetical protein
MNNTIVKNKHNDDFTVLSGDFENCVMCDKLTNVPKNLHIDYRSNYVEGAGQLCFECYTGKLEYIKE